MNDQPPGDRAGGRDDTMTATRLREILNNLRWTQRELSAVLDFRDSAQVRQMARGKSRIWPVMGEWLERIDAYQASNGFPVSIMWWNEHYQDAFAKAAEAVPPEVAAWLRDALGFFRANRWPAKDWRWDEGAAADAAKVRADLSVLDLRIYGDLGRVLRLDMREAKVWDRRPVTMQSEVMAWLSDLAKFKSSTGFPVQLFCFNPYLTASFANTSRAPCCPPAARNWIARALSFYEEHQAPDGFEIAFELTDPSYQDGFPPPALEMQ